MPSRPATVWIHRLPGTATAAPRGTFDTSEDDLRGVLRELRKPPEKLEDDPAGELQFLHDELIKHGRLRQAWGVPGLSLTQDEKSFCRKFAIAARRYWNAIPDSLIAEVLAEEPWDVSKIAPELEPFLQEAAGRRKILERMIKFNSKDIILIPGVPDANSFAVCTIADYKYTFEERNSKDAKFKWEHDYGHLRNVNNVKTYEHGRSTLAPGVFGAPFRHAIDKATGTARMEAINKFLTKEGYIKAEPSAPAV